jgi:cell wall-associated NlpC family hydrolase
LNDSGKLSSYLPRSLAEFIRMKVLFENKVKFIVLLIIVGQLLNSFCSRHIYHGKSFQNVETPAENKKLNSFLDAGTEKKIATHRATPDEIIATAQKYIGVPHCMGGTTMKCIDCSGLLVTVFAAHGISLPHNSQEQARYGKIISGTDKLMKGDLVFFTRSYKTSNFITHAGIYIGNNKFIHTSSKYGVTITSLSEPYWKEKFIFGTRVLE